MFNLFKSRAATEKVIADIHNEFDTAGEKLLADAKKILADSTDTGKAERLKKLGFIQAQPVGRAKKLMEEKANSKAIAERVEYFRTYYPNNKFITKEMVESICKKYGLLCGSIGRYIGDVPLKNIAEMEAFTLRQEDMRSYTGLHRHMNSITIQWKMNAFDQNISAMGIMGRMGNPYGHVSAPTAEEANRLASQVYYSKEGFDICAPEKDFDMTRAEKKGFFISEIPDPIVLQPVKGGYLIVSKWGLAASDELAINEGSN